jgi:copper transport protein
VAEVARRFAYAVLTGLLAALGVLAVAPAAWAHATLVSTQPAAGSIVAHAPARVTATFDEPVGVSPNSLEVLAPGGTRVDTGVTKNGSRPQEITVALRSGLGNGTYTVSWHVISADSHPVQGAFTFSIGAPSSTEVNSAGLGGHVSTTIDVTFGVVRWLAFCSFALLIGAVAFVIWCWPAGAARPEVLRLATGAWGVLAFSALAAVLLQGVYGTGQGIGHLFLPDVLNATLDSRYGRAIGARLLLVIVALFVFTIILGNLPAAGRRARATAGAVWGTLTVGLASTWAVADHAGAGSQVPLAVPADTIHFSAVAIWLGGLAMLATIVLRRPRLAGPGSGRGTARKRAEAATVEAAQAVIRFSPIALSCVAAIVASGSYAAWRNVGTLGALAGTTYGRLLLLKIAAMCALIALGYLARRNIAEGLQAAAALVVAATDAAPGEHVKASAEARTAARPGKSRAGTGPRQGRGSQANGASPDSGPVTATLARMRLGVTAEALIAAAVLAVTAVLVNTPTGREAFSPPDRATVTFDTGGAGGRGIIGITVTPARLGPNRVLVSVTSSTGRPYRPRQIQADMSLPARHIAPLSVPLDPDGPGRYLGGPVTASAAGQWQLRITIRSDRFDETTVIVPISVH